jgi:hypothetical protein
MIPRGRITEILRRYGIHYVDSGNNVAENNVAIRCPFCGTDDPSEHMGIHLRTGYWGCWRVQSHRGRKLENLLPYVIHCSRREAFGLLDDGQIPLDPRNSFSDEIAANMKLADYIKPPADEPLTFPNEFKSIKEETSKRFWSYLIDRGFLEKDIGRLVERYDLHRCMSGEWKYRLIIPAYSLKDELIGWTGRAITKSKLRYKSHPHGGQLKRHIFDESKIWEGRLLLVCEGPFDAMKLGLYSPEDVAVTCLWGVSATQEQLATLRILTMGFRRTVISFDRDIFEASVELQSRMELGKVKLFPNLAAKDPGVMTPEQVMEYISQLSEGLPG